MAQEKATTQTAVDEQQNGTLADFAWDDSGDGASFFGQGGEAFEEEDNTNPSSVMKEITSDEDDEEVEEVFKNKTGKPKAPTKKEAQTAKAKQEPEDTEDEDEENAEFNFGDEDDEEVAGDEDDEEDNQPKEKVKEKKTAKTEKVDTKKGAEGGDEDDFTDLALDLKDRGIFQHVEIGENDKVDTDKLYESIDAEVEGRVDEVFEGFFEEAGEEGTALLKHLKAGGTTRDFIQVWGNRSLNIQDFDSDNKKHREQVIAHYLRSTDAEMDDDDIKERIEDLEESGKAKKMADRYFARIQSEEEESKRELAERTKLAQEEKEKNAKAFAKSLTSLIEKTDEVKGFKFSPEDKKALNQLILNPKIKVGKNKYIPEFNYKLGEILKAGTPEAAQRLILLAKLVNTDFDMSDFKVKAKTEVSKEVKSRIKAAKRNVRPSSAGNFNNGKKALADFVD